eukprot:g5406.t1
MSPPPGVDVEAAEGASLFAVDDPTGTLGGDNELHFRFGGRLKVRPVAGAQTTLLEFRWPDVKRCEPMPAEDPEDCDQIGLLHRKFGEFVFDVDGDAVELAAAVEAYRADVIRTRREKDKQRQKASPSRGRRPQPKAQEAAQVSSAAANAHGEAPLPQSPILEAATELVAAQKHDEADRLLAALADACNSYAVLHGQAAGPAAALAGASPVQRDDLRVLLRAWGKDKDLDRYVDVIARSAGGGGAARGAFSADDLRVLGATVQMSFEDSPLAETRALDAARGRDMRLLRAAFCSILPGPGDGELSAAAVAGALRKIGADPEAPHADGGSTWEALVRRLARHRDRLAPGAQQHAVSWHEFVAGAVDGTLGAFGLDAAALRALRYGVFFAYLVEGPSADMLSMAIERRNLSIPAPAPAPAELDLPEELALGFTDAGQGEIAIMRADKMTPILSLTVHRVTRWTVASQTQDPEDMDLLEIQLECGASFAMEVEEGAALERAYRAVNSARQALELAPAAGPGAGGRGRACWRRYIART